MEITYWHKQTKDKPLFSDVLWSRPENRRNAGKLLIVGGNLHGFAAPAEAYEAAVEAGIGAAKVLLPDALKKVVGMVIESGEFASSTPSGSLSQKALAELMDYSQWADGVLIAGDVGRNSETTVLLEKYLRKSYKLSVLTKDSVDVLMNAPDMLVERPNTALVVTIAQLQQFVRALKWPQAVSFSMPLMQLVELLNNFTSTYPVNIVVKQENVVVVASGGKVSTTPSTSTKNMWRVKTAASVAVWWLQNPDKPFEALTTAVYQLAHNSKTGWKTDIMRPS